MLKRALRGLAVITTLLLGAPALAATVLYVYDELGRLVAEIDPAAETTLYSYDAAGNLLSVSRGSSSQFRIVSFAPTRGKSGDVVTIFGSGFGTTPGQNTVAFNGAPATVTASTANTLTVTVPTGVTTGPISVLSPTGSGVTATPFIVVLPPVITAVTPSAVNKSAVSRVTVSGAQLSTVNAVSFAQAGIAARVLAGATETSFVVDLTVGDSVPVGDYPFSVSNEGGTTDSGSVIVTVTTQLIGPAASVTRPSSVHLPAVVPGAPAGNRMSVTPTAVSVHLPAAIPGAPAGNAMTTTEPVSVTRP